MTKKIHAWAENKDGEVYLIGCFELNENWEIPPLSENVKLQITYEEEIQNEQNNWRQSL